jgi:hypothetical protein
MQEGDVGGGGVVRRLSRLVTRGLGTLHLQTISFNLFVGPLFFQIRH